MKNESDQLSVANRLRAAREAKRFATPKQCAEAYGWNVYTYEAHEKGARGIKPDVAETYGKALGFKAEWLLFGVGNFDLKKKESPNSKTSIIAHNFHIPSSGGRYFPLNDHDLIPMYGAVSASSPETVHFTEEYMIEEVPRHPAVQKVKGAFAMQVAGDSMAPRHRPGERVFVHPYQVPSIGQDCIVVQEPDGNAILKQFGGETLTEWKFSQLNPSSEFTLPKAEVRKIYAVVR